MMVHASSTQSSISVEFSAESIVLRLVLCLCVHVRSSSWRQWVNARSEPGRVLVKPYPPLSKSATNLHEALQDPIGIIKLKHAVS